jgi:DNA mismatch repair protein MutL
MESAGLHGSAGSHAGGEGGGAVVAPPAPARRPIAVLSPLVASQIAAGEVVERPASVVKELVENAIDAGATRIVVELEQGGIELVRVSDDGAGIPPAELALALTAHATSKVATSDELDGIATMGFRGEALASIASVSRTSIRSRTSADSSASLIEAQGDVLGPVRPVAGPVGTCVTVRNLFFNTPARRKFLRTVATEQGRCVDAVRDLAIAHPLIGFSIVSAGRLAMDVPPGQSPRHRAVAVLGPELDGQLLEVSADSGERFGLAHAGALSLWALVGTPALARATAACQHVALNGRTVRDRTIQHALKEAYRGLIEPGRHPTAVMLIEIDPRAVDVNVHPAKSEVRFRDSSMVHALVLRSVREALAAADLTPQLAHGAAPGAGAARAQAFGTGLLPDQSHEPKTSIAALLADVKARAQQPPAWPPARQPGAGAGTGWPEATGRGPLGPPGTGGVPIDLDALARARAAADAHLGPQGQATHQGQAGPVLHDDWASSRPLVELAPSTRPLRVHNSFLVTQDAQGMVIIDQHALHERVMFQTLLDRVLAKPSHQPSQQPFADQPASPAQTEPRATADGADGQEKPGRLESQRLLVPAVVAASARRIEALEASAALLERLGIDATPIGPAAIGVQAFPTFLFDRNVDAGEFMAELLDKLADDGWSVAALGGSGALAGAGANNPQRQRDQAAMVEAALADVLDMMACKAAVKAGDALSELEVMDLLAARERVERASSCPHGRPTSVRLTIADLEKLFHRT